jgi:hypothetical protein
MLLALTTTTTLMPRALITTITTVITIMHRHRCRSILSWWHTLWVLSIMVATTTCRHRTKVCTTMAGTKHRLLCATIIIITIWHNPWIIIFTITITMATTSRHQQHLTFYLIPSSYFSLEIL